jgi:AraC family transcriptional regulator
MNPIGKALWYIESHFREELTLDDVAGAAGVSRYHLSRAFPATMGQSLMRYVRGRRLSEAARTLGGGTSDILTVALETGYGSHEAFTRAFRDHFGRTPETVRARGFADLQLQEPLRMDDTTDLRLAPPVLQTHRAFRVVGLSERYAMNDLAGIPAQWQRFVPHMLALIGNNPRQTTYGICTNTDDTGVDYMCAIEVPRFNDAPSELIRLSIAEHLYAHFTHRGHVTQIKRMWHAALNGWLPSSGYELAQAPDFERYGDDFDPMRGEGLLELFVPVKVKS